MKINNFIYNINDRVVYRIDSPSILMVQLVLVDLKFIEIIHFFKQINDSSLAVLLLYLQK